MALAWLLVLVLQPMGERGDVVWRAPPECPDHVALGEQILDHGVVLDGVAISGDITPAPAGYRLSLEVIQGAHHERRVLDAQQCVALVRAAALVIALGIDPVDVAERHPPIEPAAPPPTPPRADPAPSRPGRPERPDPTPRSRPWGASFGLAGAVERGALPGVTGAVAATFVARRRGLALELGGAWFGPRTAGIDVGAVRVQLGTVVMRGCPEIVLTRVTLPLCVGVEIGAMRGDGRDAPGSRTVHGLWVAPTASGGVRIGRGVVGMLARGEVAVAAARPGFELRDPGDPLQVFTPGAVSARLWLGVEFRIAR